MRIRILPVTMVLTLMLLAVKVADVIRGGEDFAGALLVGSVKAQDSAPKPPKAPEKPKEDKKEEKKEEKKDEKREEKDEKKDEEAKAEGHGEEKELTEEEKKAREEAEKQQQEDERRVHGGVHDVNPAGDPKSGMGLAPGARYFSPIELEILQTLDRRREQLDRWGKDMEVKENLLASVEKRIDEKIVQVEVLKKDLQAMLATYNEQEDAKIKSLVKIYESMKPRDAARIFDEVEMPILLLVIDRMAEKKAAPILAAMDAKKAKQLTVELAEQRRLQNARLAGRPQAAMAPPAAAPAPPPAGR